MNDEYLELIPNERELTEPFFPTEAAAQKWRQTFREEVGPALEELRERRGRCFVASFTEIISSFCPMRA